MKARLWTTLSPEVDGIVYDFTEDRSAESLGQVLSGFDNGALVSDGYVCYETLAKKRPGLVSGGCWAHVLRKFRDALSEAPLLAALAMTQIGKLFDIEQRADGEQLSLEDRLALFDHEWSQFQSGLFYFYVSSTDQDTHMLWRNMDEDHPTRERSDGVGPLRPVPFCSGTAKAKSRSLRTPSCSRPRARHRSAHARGHR